MKTMLKTVLATGSLVLSGVGITANGSLALSGTSYTQNFDGIGSSLPNGWTVNTGGTSSSVGTAATLATAKTAWNTSTGQFANYASSDGLLSTATSADQSASTDRALGIRQTASFGNPGAAFELNIQNTLGFNNFSLSLSLQMLSVQPRSTTWTIDYRVGNSGTFTILGTYSDPGTFGSLPFTSSSLSPWNNQSQDIWFRVWAGGASSGSGNNDTFAIDDFSLTYSAVPEASTWVAGLGLSLGMLGTFVRKHRR